MQSAALPKAFGTIGYQPGLVARMEVPSVNFQRVLLFAGEPRRLLATPAFLIKMFLIVLAGFSVWILTRTLQGAERRPVPELVSPGPDVVTSSAKIAAIFPIALWLGAIVAGRLIGYTIAPPPPPA